MSFITRLWQRYCSSRRREAARLHALLGFLPENLSLYQQAFTLPTTAKTREAYITQTYERMEFLGDALLQWIVTQKLYELYPDCDEGELTEYRMKIVSGNQLIQIARKLQLQNYVIYKDKLPRTSDYLNDVLEALIGAVYLDRGYKKAAFFIHHRILSLISWTYIEEVELNHKGRLLEYIQQRHLGKVEFLVKEKRKTSRGEVFVVVLTLNGKELSSGSGLRKKDAEQQAARAALKLLVQ
ncbi:MAG: ribonuclease III [Bacteroidia bacterium]